MAHTKSLEALDRALQDLRKNQNRFGGAMISLAGDFRQSLPVIPKPDDEISASPFYKYKKYVKTFFLNNCSILVMAEYLLTYHQRPNSRISFPRH